MFLFFFPSLWSLYFFFSDTRRLSTTYYNRHQHYYYAPQLLWLGCSGEFQFDWKLFTFFMVFFAFQFICLTKSKTQFSFEMFLDVFVLSRCFNLLKYIFFFFSFLASVCFFFSCATTTTTTILFFSSSSGEWHLFVVAYVQLLGLLTGYCDEINICQIWNKWQQLVLETVVKWMLLKFKTEILN